jgi:hypothetical protein
MPIVELPTSVSCELVVSDQVVSITYPDSSELLQEDGLGGAKEQAEQYWIFTRKVFRVISPYWGSRMARRKEQKRDANPHSTV